MCENTETFVAKRNAKIFLLVIVDIFCLRYSSLLIILCTYKFFSECGTRSQFSPPSFTTLRIAAGLNIWRRSASSSSSTNREGSSSNFCELVEPQNISAGALVWWLIDRFLVFLVRHIFYTQCNGAVTSISCLVD